MAILLLIAFARALFFLFDFAKIAKLVYHCFLLLESFFAYSHKDVDFDFIKIICNFCFYD